MFIRISHDIENDSDGISRNLSVLLEFFARLMSPFLQISLKLPLPSTLRVRRALREMDAVIYRMIDSRRKNPLDGEDLLSLLVRAKDDQTNAHMTEKQLRDEIFTLLMAGHETTANVLGWTAYLLGRHPEVDARVHAEVRSVMAGRSRLDHAIEAALLLGDVAIRSDDRVGLVAFAERVVAAVAPQGGPAHLHTLATATHALQPILREPPYLAITGTILRRFPRRGLTVLFTDAMEPSSLESLAGSVRQLSARHLVLVVLFRDEYIERSRREPIDDVDDLFRVGAASDLALERAKSLEALRRSGALVIEAAAETLSTNVVIRYLEVKAAHLI